MRKLFLFLVVLVAGGGRLWGQSDQYRFSRIDINQGLSHNQVSGFLKDRRGFLWIGTVSGLNRYDGYTVRVLGNDLPDSALVGNTSIDRLFEDPDGRIWINSTSVYDPASETFSQDVAAVVAGYGLPGGTLSDIIRDRSGRYWFVHAQAGLFRYAPEVAGAQRLKSISLGDTSRIAAFAEDKAGDFWVMHRSGVLEHLGGKDLSVQYSSDFLKKRTGDAFDFRMIVDSDDDLWIFLSDQPSGVYYFDHNQKTFTHIDKGSAPLRLNTDIVRGVVEDNKGLIWVGTDHGGINIIDKKLRTVRYVLTNPEDSKSLSQNTITTLYKDDQGIIWVGTYKQGVCYYHEGIIRFPLYRHEPSNASSLSYDDVNRFVEDDAGNLWIGTNGGGLIYFDRGKHTFRPYTNVGGNSRSLSSNVIVSLFIDHTRTLWVGTYYGGLNAFDGRSFTRFRHDRQDPGSLSDDNVWELFEDSQRNLWVGTLRGGLDLYDRYTHTFHHYRDGDVNSIRSNYISAITEDREKNIWIGTNEGIDVLERQSGRFIHYGHEDKKPGSLSNGNVLSIFEDSRGFIWVGTPGGLNLFDRKSRTFRAFRDTDGLPHNTVLTILEDIPGNLWMSTPNGLSHLTIGGTGDDVTFTFKNYDESDGLQGKQFNENAAYRTRRGELVFGGANGFTIFRPEQIGINTVRPRVVLTDFQLFNRSLKAGEAANGDVILDRSITVTDALQLHHDQNVFSIEFAALSYIHPEKNKYQYMLENFNKEWLTADGKSRRVTFTNLDPGEYVFKVRASNNDGLWSDDNVALRISILPPFWKTRTAMVLYGIVVLAALLLTRRLIQQRERVKFAIEQERQEAQRMHELDMMKIRFFTNVSHEFRTPLTLILTPLEKLLKHTEDAAQQEQFQMIHRNAKRLLNLVNQLLDFRKLEVQEIRFNPSEGDIVSFVRETVYSFSDLSEKKDIRLEFVTALTSLETIFDQDKLEKILFNLLSNAFKFTPEHGSVRVTLGIVTGSSLTDDGSRGALEISVTDTGIGIPADKQDRIFERFFQHDVPKSMVNPGTGIGLSITREFVRAHGGTITVTSEPDRGSTFTVLLPLRDIGTTAAPEIVADVAVPLSDGEHLPMPTDKRPVLLLVEDNEDFRFYLKDNLRQQYQVLEARHGKEGLQQALHHIPDLIVSDVMMPEMNGIELCRRIREDQRVSHIPIILLTARTAEEQKVEGFDVGADDYITKPFSFEILQSRVKNLIHQREVFHKDFRRQIDVRASDVKITSLDEKLIQNAIKLVEDNIADGDFSVEHLSRELGMSRVHLYKKLMSLTGKAPLEFIRSIRLQRAAQLLEKSQLTVSEVAYQVGFNNPKYFARYFKEEFHMLPSAYAAAHRKAG